MDGFPYSKCSNNHFHYSAHFARSSSSSIPISDFRFAGIAVIFCWSRTCANIQKKRNSILCWNRTCANIPKTKKLYYFAEIEFLQTSQKTKNSTFCWNRTCANIPKTKTSIFCWNKIFANIPKTKNNKKVLQTKQQRQQRHYQHQQKSIKTKLTVSVSRPLMASSMVASIHSSLSVTFATSVLVWIC